MVKLARVQWRESRRWGMNSETCVFQHVGHGAATKSLRAKRNMQHEDSFILSGSPAVSGLE
jgi:hypothetical protein